MAKGLNAVIGGLALISAAGASAQDLGRVRQDPAAREASREDQPDPAPRITGRSAPPSVLAILAHPDDEITIAPILARIARQGGKVTLVYATSGDAGPGSSGLEASDEIAELREREGRCAAFALGLEDPVFWRLGDGTLGTLARMPGSAAKQALAKIEEAIAEANPKVIMTWGPDGGYGHSDHRMISALVTQVVSGLGRGRPDLLYAAFPSAEADAVAGFENWATTSSDLITDTIRYRPSDLDATETALECYESQFPLPARQGLVRLLHESVWRGKVHFRQASPNPF